MIIAESRIRLAPVAWYCCLTAIGTPTEAFFSPCTRGVAKLPCSQRLSSSSTVEAASGPRRPFHLSPAFRSPSFMASTEAGDGQKAPVYAVKDGSGATDDCSKFNAGGLSVSSRVWGEVYGAQVHRVDLDTVDGFGASFVTYGATLVSLRCADKLGSIEEVTLQHDTLEEIVGGNAYYGSTVGRVCNRISAGSFSIAGEPFTMAKNNGPNCLHGGLRAFDKVLWRHEVFGSPEGVGVRFTYISPDGEEGFPGDLAVKVTYMIRRGTSKAGTGELHTEMEAKLNPSRGIPSPVNLTNHCYWNLSGSSRENIRGHGLSLQCDRFLPLDENQIPTGKLESVHGTFFDFSEERSLGEVIDGIGGDPPGLDNCLVLSSTGADGKSKAAATDDLALMARLREPRSGRVMKVFGSQPALQVYTANYLSTDPGDKPHVQHNAVCLETQHFPDAINQDAWRDSVLLQPGATYLQRARHEFSTDW